MDNGGSDAASLGMGYEATASDPFIIDDDAKGGDKEKKGLRAFRACEFSVCSGIRVAARQPLRRRFRYRVGKQASTDSWGKHVELTVSARETDNASAVL